MIRRASDARELLVLALLLSVVVSPVALAGGVAITGYENVSPENSDTDDNDPDGATGGRINGLAIDPQNPNIMYAASEWGGLYKSPDAGLTWAQLTGHLPVATWDVEVDPDTPSRVYASSFFDGKIDTQAVLNVSLDAGVTWTRPATASPPEGFCQASLDQTEPSGFGISIDPLNPANVFVGTGCGLAVSNDFGVTWTYRDPTPAAGSATRIWDVLAMGGGVVHVCGNDGHLRSDDGGGTWVAGSGLASGRCSLAVSPDEPYVLLAVVGTSIYETTDGNAPGGATWTQTRNNPSPQGRIPFVHTNQRSDDGEDNVFDLWFGDVSLHRARCTTPDPAAPGGSPRCGTGNSPPWAGGFTRQFGGHDDTGAMLFDPLVTVDACPILFSSDGGVYYNTVTDENCHTPFWEQPDVTPHALWPWTMVGVDRAGSTDEDLYFGLQDNGVFGTVNAGDASPDWHNAICCDGFDTGGDPDGGFYSVCCFGGGRSTRYFRTLPGAFGATELNEYPPSGLAPSFDFPDAVANFGGQRYVVLTRDCTPGAGGCPGADGGVFITSDIDANPIVWTELGQATEPPTNNICGVQVSMRGVTPSFFVQTGNCNGTSTNDRLFSYSGVDPSGTWTELVLPDGGFGVVAVHPTDPDRLMASGLSPAGDGGTVYASSNGGTTWDPLPALHDLMTGGGAFNFRNRRGPEGFTNFFGYWQPSLLGFDANSDLMVAGGQDSGIFLSTDGGANWQLITDPFTSDVSGIPHLPRPRYAYFDAEEGVTTSLYIGSQGGGIWRIGLNLDPVIFLDGFESGDTTVWSTAVP